MYLDRKLIVCNSPQELGAISPSHHTDEGGTLNAIGRALLQMQQGSQNQHTPISSANQQIFLTRASSTETDVGNQNGKSGYVRGYLRWCFFTLAPLYVMIPPASSAEILQAMGQTRPIAPKTTTVSLNMSTPEESTSDP